MTMTEVSLVNGGPDFTVALVPDLRALAPMRREVARRLQECHVVPSAIEDLLLILSELCTNAIEFTAPGGEAILVRVQLGATAITLEVQNSGVPFATAATTGDENASSDAERGRGLIIVRALADVVTLRHHDGRSVVTAVMALR